MWSVPATAVQTPSICDGEKSFLLVIFRTIIHKVDLVRQTFPVASVVMPTDTLALTDKKVFDFFFFFLKMM